jgi:hypothetical protein
MPSSQTHPVQVRLPEWAFEFVESVKAETGGSRTAVLIEALTCLMQTRRERELAVGYLEMVQHGDPHVDAAMLSLSLEALEDWR